MRAFSLAAIVISILLMQGTAWGWVIEAEPWGAQVSGVQESGLAWNYTVTNTSTDQKYTLWLLSVEVDEGVEILDATCPSGWTADHTSQPHSVTWMCNSVNLRSGKSLSGFRAILSAAPTRQTYAVMFDNSDTGATPVGYGTVSTVPEPATAAVLASGLMSLVAVAARRRR